MISKLQNPIVVACLSVMLSVGMGVSLSWRALSAILEQQPPPKKHDMEPEELQRKGWDFWTIEMENLSSELKEERARLAKQAELLEQRAARVAAEEKEFAKLRAAVEVLRTQIEARIIEITADESKNIRGLAAAYTNLTPRAAVAILREMEDITAVKILSLMKADVIGPIFEEMSRPGEADSSLVQRAAMLSEKLRLMKASKTGNPS